jgi:hypothetical protein
MAIILHHLHEEQSLKSIVFKKASFVRINSSLKKVLIKKPSVKSHSFLSCVSQRRRDRIENVEAGIELATCVS